MWGTGKRIGLLVILLTLLFAAWTFWYTEELSAQREEYLATIPPSQECADDPALCPQAENIQVPNTLGIAIVLLSLILAVYLFRSDQTQQQILKELRKSDTQNQEKEQQETILSVLKPEEKKTLLAIRDQDGISQNTLRLRTDFSKAKLSTLLKELESRELITKVKDGKTNRLHMKRKL